ncbi:MAG TPA: type II toxin-antitoxin system YafQ family toxin [Tepidisphaeraceae bacterium]|nr:type II toxin-antitoxin system YafQ family toxin [Tepidisphaeraceae bacterium]
MNRPLLRSSAFIRGSKRFVRRHPQVAGAIRETLRILQADALDPRLRTHKLKGDLSGCWACSAGYDLRIVFEFVVHQGSEAILLLSIGTHDEVY